MQIRVCVHFWTEKHKLSSWKHKQLNLKEKVENDRGSFLSLFCSPKITNVQTLKKCKLHICADNENMLKCKNTGDNILSTREKRYNQKERDS